MTTIDAAAARNVHRQIAYAVLAAVLALGVSGCTTSGGVLSGLVEQPATVPVSTAATTTAAKGKVSIAPLIGPPDNVSTQLTAQLGSALQQSGVQVVTTPAGQKTAADYTLRGYIVAARETAGTKVSYIWDVANPAGQRVNRITGEEVVAGAASADPWASVSPAVIQTIASKTATSLSAWMPNKAPAATPQPASAVPVASNAAAKPVRTAQAAPSQPLAPAATTGSIPQSKGLAVVVPSVVGAPGDGASSLALALQGELRKKSIPLASGASVASAHRIEGKVALAAAGAGKQKISIDWVVKDPRGNKLGTVSQKNEIPAGSLNGKWGGTASAAAAAAAQGIIRLLPQKTASR